MEKQQKISYDMYGRKSSEAEDRQVLSLPAQHEELQALVKQNNFSMSSIRLEARSAKERGRRPEFNKMIQDIENGRTQGIITWHPDRLSRNAIETAVLVDLMDRELLLEIFTPSQTFRNTPTDKFMFSLLCNQAKMDNDNKSVNVRRGLRQKARMGSFPAACLPEGYVRDRSGGKGNTKIISDPTRLPLIKRAWHMMLSGKYTAVQVRDVLNNKWGYRTRKGNKLGRSSIYYIFSNTFYYGAYRWNDEWYQGTHETIITPEEYDRVQLLLGRKGRPRPKKHKLVFAGGIIRCSECGAGVTGEEKIKRQKNGNVHRYIYYHCTKRVNPNCTQGSIEEKELVRQVHTALDSLSIPPEFHDFAMKWFKKENEKKFDVIQKSVRSQEQSYADCLKRLKNLNYMRANNEITPEEFHEMRGAELELKAQIEQERKKTGQEVEAWMETGDEMLTFIESAKEKLANGSYSVKRGILQTLGSNLQLKDRKVLIDLEESLFPMQEVSKQANAVYERVRTAKNPLTTKELVDAYSSSPNLLAVSD